MPFFVNSLEYILISFPYEKENIGFFLSSGNLRFRRPLLKIIYRGRETTKFQHTSADHIITMSLIRIFFLNNLENVRFTKIAIS